MTNEDRDYKLEYTIKTWKEDDGEIKQKVSYSKSDEYISKPLEVLKIEYQERIDESLKKQRACILNKESKLIKVIKETCIVEINQKR